MGMFQNWTAAFNYTFAQQSQVVSVDVSVNFRTYWCLDW